MMQLFNEFVQVGVTSWGYGKKETAVRMKFDNATYADTPMFRCFRKVVETTIFQVSMREYPINITGSK